MSRYARGKEPYAPKMEHVEVPESHVKLRAILFVLAILLAVVAFGFGLNSLLTPETGWKAVEASGSNSGEITLQYNYGAGVQGTAAERRQVNDVYSTALTQAEQQLSQAGNNTVSLYTVSTNPNQTVTVEPILYRALERFCATSSRAIYYGPLYSRYYALFASQYDEAAAEYDPARSSDAGAFAAQIAAFAQNPDQIDLELLGENQVRLNVGKEYLAYARENELDTLLDFGFVKNAFVIDAVADALTDAGLTGAVLTSTDGFSRSLCQGSFGVNLLEATDSGYRQAAAAAYNGPRSVAALRAFPVDSGDALRFYIYEDGTICPPVLDETTGLLTAANDNLVLFGDGSVGDLALQAMQALSHWDLEGLSCLYSRENAVYCTDKTVEVSQLFAGVTLIRE